MSTQNKRNFKKGDKVRFLNDVGGGLVKRLRNDGMILIENEDGFEYPVPPAELVLIEAAGYSGGSGEVQTGKTADDMRVQKNDNEKKVLLAFVRNDSNNGVEMYLINDTPWYFPNALYSRTENDTYHLIVQDVLEPDTKMEIGSFMDNELDEIRNIAVQGFFAGDSISELMESVLGKVKLKPSGLLLSKNFQKTAYFNRPALIFDLYDSEKQADKASVDEIMAEKALQDSIDASKQERSKKHPAPVVWEEDLHINELVDSVVGMSNTEILNYQMDHFRKILDKAIVEKVSNVIFIHGIGNGTLKTTLRKALEKEYKLYYEDASFKEYGFGATKVFPGRRMKRSDVFKA